jgi:hypothetical protein
MPVATIDEYLAGLPDEVRERMQTLRALVHRVVPGVDERISYAMPTFAVDGWTRGRGRRVARAKDAMHLPHTRELPLDLVEQVLRVLAAPAGASS